MVDFKKRSWIITASACAVTAAALVACGKKEEAKPAEPAKAEVKAEPLKIAFAYVGPVGDGGWERQRLRPANETAVW